MSSWRRLIFFLSWRLLATFATQITTVAVSWGVFARTENPLDLGFVGLAIFVPSIALSLVSGTVADRFDRRKILLICASGTLLCNLVLMRIAGDESIPLSATYAVLFMLGSLRAFHAPASQAFLPQLVSDAMFPRAVALGSTIWHVGMLVGPALGGGVIAMTGGSKSAYGLSAMLLFIAVFFLPRPERITRRASGEAISVRSLFAGFRFVRQEKLILGAITLDLVAVFLGGAVALLPFFAKLLDIGPTGFGLLRSAPSLGAVIAALYFSRRPLESGVGPKMFLGVLVFGVFTIVFGLSRDAWLSFAALVIMGAADLVSVVLRHTITQMWTPDELRGRVSAVNMVCINASNELGEFESGATAALFGVVPAVVVGGVGTCAVVGLWALMFPELWKMDRIDAHREQAIP